MVKRKNRPDTESATPPDPAAYESPVNGEGKPKRKMVYASFLIFGIKADGSQKLLHTAANRHRAEKWLAMAREMIADNYVGLTIVKGRDVTHFFVDAPTEPV